MYVWSKFTQGVLILIIWGGTAGAIWAEGREKVRAAACCSVTESDSATLRTAAHQVPLSFTISRSLLKFMSIMTKLTQSTPALSQHYLILLKNSVPPHKKYLLIFTDFPLKM